MIPELGHMSLIISLCFAFALAFVPMAGVVAGRGLWMSLSRSLAAGLFVFTTLSLLCLVQAFLADDFSVAYVSNNSNTLLPDPYKVSAVWGSHEGSMLLWVWILTLWTAAVGWFSRNLPLDMVARVLSIMGVISIGFLLFLLLTSNPFERILPGAPQEGSDLNPLLQDFGLIIHPPMLYFGYVGFSVAFAFAIAALLSGRLDAAWARWSRPWTNIAWMFLTIGIALGSWWAYYELGWGGWWFWDPVENASLMPWLAGTGLMHSLSVAEKRGTFKAWTLLLAIFAFSLSLLGTFLVRSGVLTSVHAFAADPGRGMFVLVFLGIVVGGSLTLFAMRVPVLKNVVTYGSGSREMFIVINNLLLVVILSMVLFGTLYPLFADALGLGKVSVGAPFFNFFFVPLSVVLAAALGLVGASRWKRTDWSVLLKPVGLPLVVAIVAAILVPLLYGEWRWKAALGALAGVWVMATVVADYLAKLRNADNWWVGSKRLSGSYWGMVVAHFGVGVCIMGVTIVSLYHQQLDMRMAPGEVVTAAGYDFEFQGSREVQGANYVAQQGVFVVRQDGEEMMRLMPEKRRYHASGQIMTEASIDPGFTRDLYVALGEPLENGAWAVRVHYKPLVRWIWLGGILMALGGLLAVLDKRYRKSRVAKSARAPLVAAEA